MLMNVKTLGFDTKRLYPNCLITGFIVVLNQHSAVSAAALNPILHLYLREKESK